jgi:hypothetical protein
MAHRSNSRNSPSKRLIPTGNVDDVLLTGKSRGKDLTLFQAIGLAVFGLCLILGAGIPCIAFQSVLRSQFEKIGLPYTTDFSSILFGSLLCLLGGIWIVMGLVGITKAVKGGRSANGRRRI